MAHHVRPMPFLLILALSRHSPGVHRWGFDANDNGIINALDITNLINFLNKYGSAPCQL